MVGAGDDVLTSLAGRVSEPALPVGRVRIGGFGGVDGLADFLGPHQITAVVDATHPFAAQISANAAAAAPTRGVPLLRLERPGWADHPQAGSWTWVADTVRGPAARRTRRDRPFLTTGRQSLEDFLPWADRRCWSGWSTRRSSPLPAGLDRDPLRGPYDYADERRLMLDHAVDVLLTKDSGGDHTAAKLRRRRRPRRAGGDHRPTPRRERDDGYDHCGGSALAGGGPPSLGVIGLSTRLAR